MIINIHKTRTRHFCGQNTNHLGRLFFSSSFFPSEDQYFSQKNDKRNHIKSIQENRKRRQPTLKSQKDHVMCVHECVDMHPFVCTREIVRVSVTVSVRCGCVCVCVQGMPKDKQTFSAALKGNSLFLSLMICIQTGIWSLKEKISISFKHPLCQKYHGRASYQLASFIEEQIILE